MVRRMSTWTLLATREAAERLGVDRRRIVRMVQSGTLKPVQKLPGETGAYLFAAADIERLEADRWAAS